MKQVQQLFAGAVILAVGLPATGVILVGVWPVALGLLALGPLWLNARRWRWLSGLSFALGIAGIALTVGMGVGSGWQLTGITAALAAWDLEAFERRLSTAERVENERALVRTHLRHLSAVCAGGLLLGVLASMIQVRLSFGAALLLASLAVLGLGYVLRSSGENETPA